MRNNPKPSRSYLLSRVRHNIPLYLMFLPGAIYLPTCWSTTISRWPAW